jgi:hypothetical protein
MPKAELLAADINIRDVQIETCVVYFFICFNVCFWLLVTGCLLLVAGFVRLALPFVLQELVN